MVWGGLIRIFLFQHVTFSINSICHMFGKRPFRTRDESRNVWLLALPTSASRGTTVTTRSRRPRCTGSSAVSSTSPPR